MTLFRSLGPAMSALAKLLRTTAFRLTLVYLLVVALFAAFLLGYFALNTRRLINEQIERTVTSEVSELSDQYDIGGLRRLVYIVESRANQPGSNLYLVTMPNGAALAGNVGSLEPGVIESVGWVETAYRRLDETEGEGHVALVKVAELPGGFRLLVGRDLAERERLFRIVATAGRWSVAIVLVLGLAGGLFVSRRVLRRVDAMTDTTRTIMAGDLTGRLPIAGTGDELDRLASNLNVMLDRIEALMRGLKEVSDNVAHDLKTPLTRLRNQAEAALRNADGEGDYRAALEKTIAESDGLIRTFDALLMIARAESGELRDNMAAFDAAGIARDVGELYEPLAEEKGLSLRVEAVATAPVRGNRELVGQAIANLIDNAIKYSVLTLEAEEKAAQAPAPALAEVAGRPAGGPDEIEHAPASAGSPLSPGRAEGAEEAGQQAPRAGDNAPPEIVVRARIVADRVELEVADRGPGIGAGDRVRVLDRFVRLEQSRSQPGSGLGLSLASAIARLHGGDLRLEDNAPGLRAVLSLPRAAPP
ncbi:Sensor protein basS/pmrB [Rhodovulum sp. PH10]|uniref:sensor histidine kinase n=1 Tax=Rhodovulum sp. PH10 TaxID=1187851 RepID=UPI00027C2821|nr:ATP-binding protein [Rhodovulum sp. PH10]EJW10186.1 Sensor protein basS/pmrB [Rhodovulum sp. PH10]